MARSPIIYNPSLSKAVQDLLSQMNDAGYGEGTQKKVLIRLRPIQTYMDSEMIYNYTPDVGDRYLESYFQTHNPANVKNIGWSIQSNC